MKFTEIQDEKTKKITRYYIDQIRVNKYEYREEEDRKKIQGKTFSCFLTSRTAKGNFKHTKYSLI